MKNELGVRLRAARKDCRMTLEQVGETIGVSHQAIQQIETGKTTPKAETLALLAELYKISLDDVMIGNSSVVGKISSKARKVPLLPWGLVSKWREQLLGVDFVDTTAKVSGEAFAVRVTGDSMVNKSGFPSFPNGAIVVCDPSIRASSGDYVIASIGDGCTFKKLEIDGGIYFLKPLNEAYPIMKIDSPDLVIGVVKQAIIDL